MIKCLILIMAIFCLLFFSMCCDEPISAIDKVKDPRTYTWTIDTLSYPGSMQTSMREIWASSPTDVYVVGHNDQNKGLMYHFDGTVWTDVKLSTTQGGTIQGAIDLCAIYGFGPNDIYATGERLESNPFPPPNLFFTSLVIHYNGTTWNEISPSDSNLIETVWGSNGNIWCSGFEAIVYNYSAGLWTRDSLNIIRDPQWFTAVNSISGSGTGRKYALANSQQKGSFEQTYYYLINNAGSWAVVDTFVYGPSSLVHKWGISKVWVSPTNRVFSLGPDLYEWNGTVWQNIKHSDQSFLQAIYSTGDDNIFVGGTYAILLHYNGKDWYSFDQFSTMDVHFKGIWANEKEVFVIGNTDDGSKTIVLHGR